MIGTDLRKLQQQAAACTDELLDITEDVGEQVLPLYQEEDRMMFDLQCRLQIRRCEQLSERLGGIRGALDAAVAEETQSMTAGMEPEAPGASDAGAPRNRAVQNQAAAERISSARITRQLIDQNLVLTGQKKALLQELLNSSAQASDGRRAAEKMKDTAQIAQLKNALAKEMEQCRSAKEISH